jgi:hypothetical protein
MSGGRIENQKSPAPFKQDTALKRAFFSDLLER